MSKTITLEIDDNYFGNRLDKVLAENIGNTISRQLIQKLFLQKNIFVNDIQIDDKNYRVKLGDKVKCIIPIVETQLFPIEQSFECLFEDEHIIVVNKPSGLVVYPGNGKERESLVQIILAHCKLSMSSGNHRPGIVHRLDKETSGVIILAKTDLAYFSLIKQFSDRKITKIYFAIVKGVPSLQSGSIKLSIARHSTKKTQMSVNSRGKHAHTDWKLEKILANGKHSLLSCNILTGRTHQIRVHLSEIGHPILGDKVYGRENLCNSSETKRLFLHAHKLTIYHPVSNEKQTFVASMPAEFLSLF